MWDLEQEAKNDVERNSVRQTYLKINDLSSIKFPNQAGGGGGGSDNPQT